MFLNPMNKIYPWQLAALRNMWVAYMRMPFVISEAFWTAWTNVMFPEGRK